MERPVTAAPSARARFGVAQGHLQCALLSSAMLLVVELALHGLQDAATAFAAAGVCLLGGFLFGGLWSLAVAVSAWRRPLPVWIGWVAGCGLLSHALNDALGVYPRLWGEQQRLALAALGGSSGFALSLLGLAWLMRPRERFPEGVLVALRPALRWLGVLLLLGAAAGAVVVDRRIEVGDYEAGHLALRLLSLLGAGSALYVALPPLREPSRIATRALVPLAAAIALSPFFTLHSDHALRHELRELPIPDTVVQLIREGTDFDGDGYSNLLGGGDCAPFDGGRHPGAHDEPGNGIDENCRFGDVPVGPARDITAPPATGKSPVSVVLITVDSLAAGHLGSYGGNPAVAPNLDRWAQGSLRFENAYTSGGWTSLAISSMFRGLYPRRLRWAPVFETNFYRMLLPSQVPHELQDRERVRLRFMLPIGDPRKTLPQWLGERGMRTVAVVDDGYTEVLSAKLGALPGFSSYHEVATTRSRRPYDRKVTRRARKSLRVLGKRPFFMWLHYFGPHLPSTPHTELPEFGEGTPGRYDVEIHYFDRAIAPLLKSLESKAEKLPLVVIMTSDHGEDVLPNWRGHGRHLRESNLRIPLFMRGPGIEPGVTQVPASLVDIMPTILTMTNTPGPEDMDGRDLLGLVASPTRRVLLTDSWRVRRDGKIRLNQSAAFDGTTKLTTDLLHVSTWQAKQSDPEERAIWNEPPPPWLERALARYLELHGDLWMK